MIAALEEDGWRQVRTSGSHRQFKHHVKPGVVTVSGKAAADVRPGTLANIRRQAQLEDLR